jgi:8-oxo-dGTP pyrophosphatase MutT (NUDIX family)
MPSAYTCIYTGNANNGQVMIATKNRVCAWHGYKPNNANNGGVYEDWRRKPSSQVPLPAPVLHNPGQPVLPGGKVEKNENAMEPLQQAAYREFEEETGIRFENSDVTPKRTTERYFTYQKNKPIDVSDTQPEDGYSFGVVYVELDKQSYDAVVVQVNKNLNFNKPLHRYIEKSYKDGLTGISNQSSSKKTGPIRNRWNDVQRYDYRPKHQQKQISNKKEKAEYAPQPWQTLQDKLKTDNDYKGGLPNLTPLTKDDELECVNSMSFQVATDTVQQATTPDNPTDWFVAGLGCLDSITKEATPSPENTISASKETIDSSKAEMVD